MTLALASYANGLKLQLFTHTTSNEFNVEVITKEVEKSDEISPVAQDLITQGIDAFGIPIEYYYEPNEGKATRKLADILKKSKIPSITFVTHTTLKGSLMYMGYTLKTVGRLARELQLKSLSTIKIQRIYWFRNRRISPSWLMSKL